MYTMAAHLSPSVAVDIRPKEESTQVRGQESLPLILVLNSVVGNL
jgi:hypothetical protein